MNTPICDFVRAYAQSDALRLHMPGHKGTDILGAERLDITEIAGADVLYAAEGIIRESEDNATELFGTQKTVYSAEGSSLAIRGMLFLALQYAKQTHRRPLIAAGRNAHKTFVTAAALLDMEVDWLYAEQQNLLSCRITPAVLESYLQENDPMAVYVTSPDYLGNTVDIAALSAVCHAHNVLLLVDNAHGAYLRFLSIDRHPITLGADLCCDSAHKTLPVLTGGAYLHIAKGAPQFFFEQAEEALSLFASTSPSYLILQSLDAANAYLANGYRERLQTFVQTVNALKDTLREKGYELVGDEPLKLTLQPKAYGYTGMALAALLEKRGIVCEFADTDHITFMLTPETGETGVKRLKSALLSIEPRPPVEIRPPEMTKPQTALSMYDALFSNAVTLPVTQCVGRVLATPTVSCPPAVPIVVCGEVISKAVIDAFAYYGIDICKVVKEEKAPTIR